MIGRRTQEEINKIIKSVPAYIMKNLYMPATEDPTGLEGATDRGREVAEDLLRKEAQGRIELDPAKKVMLQAFMAQPRGTVINPKMAYELEKYYDSAFKKAYSSGRLKKADIKGYISFIKEIKAKMRR